MNDFEKAVNEIDGSSDSPECVIEWLRGNKTATVTFPNNTKFKSKVKKLAEQYPDEVQVVVENKDGSIVAHVPVSYIKVSAPRRVNYTDEQKKKFAENLLQARKKKKDE